MRRWLSGPGGRPRDANLWLRFEQAKKELPPWLTPEQYTRAVQSIAKNLGI